MQILFQCVKNDSKKENSISFTLFPLEIKAFKYKSVRELNIPLIFKAYIKGLENLFHELFPLEHWLKGRFPN
jgi:hypothetical protein